MDPVINDKIISSYFKGTTDQIIRELHDEGVEINHDLIANTMRRYVSSLRCIRSFHDIDSQNMNERQKEFIKTIINDEKAKGLYKQYLKNAAALKQEHIKSIDEITKPFKFTQSIQELDTIHSGLINASLLDLLVNGVTIQTLGKFVENLEEIAISKHITVKMAFNNVITRSEKDLEAIRRLVSERRAKKWLKDRRDSEE